MKTPMTLLFEEFESLSSTSRKAGDKLTSNLIDFLCERKKVALEKEKEHIIEAYLEGANYTNDEHVTFAKKYYNQKYK